MPAFAEETVTEATADLQTYGVVAGDDSGANEAGPLKRAEMTVLLSKLYGMQAEAEAYELPGTFEDLDATWEGFVPYINFAKAQGWMSGDNDTTFRPEDAMKAQEVNAMLLKALGYTVAWEDVNTEAAAMGFAVDAADDTLVLRGEGFAALRAALDVMPMDAEVTLGSELGLEDKGYVAPVVVPEAYEATVAMAGVKAVEVTFNMPVEEDAATILVKKGAAIYGSAVTWNEEMTVATVATVIELPADTYTVEVAGLEDEVMVSELVVVAEVATTIEVVTTSVDLGTNPALVEFMVKNQYGEDMAILDTAATFAGTLYNVTKAAAVTAAAVDGDKYVEFNATEVADVMEAADVIRVTVSYNGLIGQGEVTIMDPAALSAFNLGGFVLATDDTLLNVSDATVDVTYTALDQYGEAYELADAGAAALPVEINGITFVSSNEAVVDTIAVVTVDEVSYVQFNTKAAGTALVTAINNATGAVTTTTIVVNADAGVDTVVMTPPATLVADGETVELELVITDQYGAVIENDSAAAAAIVFDNGAINADGKLEVTVTEGTFVIEAGTGADADAYGTVSFTVEAAAFAQAITATSFETVIEQTASVTLADTNITVLDQYGRDVTGGTFFGESATEANITDGTGGAGGTAVLTAATAGDSVVTVSYTFGGATVTKDVTVTSLASADIESYTVAAIDTIYASTGDDAYDVAVEIQGVDADGNTVKLVATAPDVITSSNEAIAQPDTTGLKVDGVAAGTATISAWKDGVVIGTVNVTVSDDAPVAQSVEWTAATVSAANDADTIVLVKDQYGVDITATTTLFFAGGTEIATTGVITDGDALTDEVETITVITSNGLSAVEDVTVTP
jgi:hypothetical protein